MIRNKTLLFVHQNFPGQFLHLCRALSAENRIFFITKPTQNRLSNVRLVEYTPHRKPNPETHLYLRTLEDAVLHGQGVARLLLQMQKENIRPDVIIGHSGWGETQFVKDVFPDVPLLSYIEFFYSAVGADVGFDPEFPSNPELRFQLRIRNQMILSCLEATDVGLSPTAWQHSRIPAIFQPKVEIIHDGVDTDLVTPANNPRVTLGHGLTFDGSVPLVTYVARNLEPYRGFHVFMRAVGRILEANPTAHIVIVGGDGVSYGSRLPEGESYKARALKENPVDESRVHFVGKLDYDVFKQLLQVSDAHVYLTYPFVLSWSMLESMASECLLIGSRTPPVEEVVRHGENGLLVDFFDPREIAETVTEALRRPELYREMRRAARRTVVEGYDLKRVCLPRQIQLIERMLG
ncbi:glycosyltransferase family 4 protein [Aureimonas sp. AU12]|uniref:glycosyltransferase family 4 protein n=1 Tax=Aureimonas sp. AU12 TaxID=1638161 RepID=UPI00078041FF|nr:glycosyltransferase family 4 protein [Aureimonas sp. AU12]